MRIDCVKKEKAVLIVGAINTAKSKYCYLNLDKFIIAGIWLSCQQIRLLFSNMNKMYDLYCVNLNLIFGILAILSIGVDMDSFI